MPALMNNLAAWPAYHPLVCLDLLPVPLAIGFDDPYRAFDNDITYSTRSAINTLDAANDALE